MAGSYSTFLAQTFFWAAGIGDDRMGFSRRGLWTIARRARHRSLKRPLHLGLLTAGLNIPNITALHAFWLNQRLKSFRVSIDPDPATVDIYWVYSQDPLPANRRARIEDAIRRARTGTPVINPPEVFDAYHEPDIFARLAEAGASVPRSSFGVGDIGKSVMLKPMRKQSEVIGPIPWDGPRPGMRVFEFIDARGKDGIYRRYRAAYLLGRSFAASCQASKEPVVRAHNRQGDNSWTLTEAEKLDLQRTATVTGLDFFTADLLRPADGSATVLTDINVFPMLKERDLRPGHYGHRHDFSVLRPVDHDGMSAWDWLELALKERVSKTE